MNRLEPEVLIIGGGPAGLTAAARLAPHVERRGPRAGTRVERRRDPAAQRPPGLRDPRPAHLHHRARLRPPPRRPGRQRGRDDTHLNDGHRLDRRRRRRDDRSARTVGGACSSGRAGHRRPRAPAAGPAHPRRSPARRLHHRPVAEPRPRPSQDPRRTGRRGRRRTGQLVGGHDAARGRLRHGRDAHGPGPSGVLRRLQSRRSRRVADADPHPDSGRRHQGQRTGLERRGGAPRHRCAV